ncbi:MAG: hypothetical protein C5B49_06815 [Bdellovibrio sp.]|nr:MAG: hypothetical protein C5B49_06815 [Bdellovibrio sp.]
MENIGAKFFGLNSRTWDDLEDAWGKMMSVSPTHMFLLNAGHDSREIQLPKKSKVTDVLPGIAEFKLGSKRAYLLAEGRLLNLAAAI